MQSSSIEWKTVDGGNLALGLSSIINDKLAEIAHEVKNESKLSNHRLAEVVTLLARESFPSSRVGVTHLKRLTKRLWLKPAELGAILNLFERIKEVGLFYYPSIEAFYETLVKEAKSLLPLSRVNEVFLELFLLEANTRLQRLYRVCYYASGEVGTAFSLHPYKNFAFNLVERLEVEKAIAWLKSDGNGDKERFLSRLSRLCHPIIQVNFRFTHHCNIECRHCYNRSGHQVNHGEINTQDMLNIIREMPREKIRHLNITGGEPMLFPETVYELLREARLCGITGVRIITNGFWGKSTDIACETLRGLKNAGFHDRVEGKKDSLQISTGVFHQEFIPWETALTAAETYFDFFGVPADFHYEALHWPQEKELEVKAALVKRGMEKKVRFIQRTVTPTGRGSNLYDKKVLAPDVSLHCCSGINQIVIDPDGHARPCCGMNSEIDGLVFGNIKDGLKVLCRNMMNDPLLQFISQKSFDSIYAFIGKESRPESRGSLCLLCRDAFKDKASADLLRLKLSPFQEFYPFDFR